MKKVGPLFRTAEDALHYAVTYHSSDCVMEVRGGFRAVKKTAPTHKAGPSSREERKGKPPSGVM